MRKLISGLSLLVWLCMVPLQGVHAEQKYNDSAALNGIEKAKGVFLIDFKTAKTTAFYMDLIVGTYDGFKRQGVEPEIVVVVIGPTVQFLSKDAKPELAFEYEESFDSIQKSIKALAQRNVRIEICAIATDVFDVDNEKLPKELEVVADGFISLIGWQTQGYKLVPVF
ncbi:DsrE family protein [Neptuniibacter sp. QD29_5]|uniref:DsrE family protein n=1 Tax=Neptuniibacter sp. QD29_5 TaxID=3398207 RepID=UPI0039F6291D